MDALFNDRDFAAFQHEKLQTLANAVAKMSPDELRDVDRAKESARQAAAVEPIVLRRGEATFHPSEPTTRGGRRVMDVTVSIPFEGEALLFRVKPTTRTTVYPRGQIRRGAVLLADEFSATATDDEIRARIKNHVDGLEKWVGFVNQNARELLTLIDQEAHKQLMRRRDELSRLDQLRGDLGTGI